MGKLIQEGRGERLEPIARMNGWVSPLLGIRFELEKGAELKIYRPDGQPFATYLELNEKRQQAERRAEQERLRAERLAARLREMDAEFDE